MPKQRSRRGFLAAAGTAATLGLAGCTGGISGDTTDAAAAADTTDEVGATGEASATNAGSGAVTVFHAGSLTVAFNDLEADFTSEYDARVTQESAGSARSTKKVTQPPHRAADVLAVADFRLLRDGLLPDYGDWYAIFATNAMTVAYTADSAYAAEFGPDTWWDVLARDDVAVGHSDPAVDPNGYRSLMAMDLGAIPFEGNALYDEAARDAMKVNATNPASDEVDLVAQLRSGKLDYAWGYESAAESHGVRTVDLQPEVDLSKLTSAYAEHYAKAEVEVGGATYTGSPIAYGVTVPSTADHPEWGATWVEYMLGDGASALDANGFVTLDTAVVPESHADAVPPGVLARASAESSLGPMDL